MQPFFLSFFVLILTKTPRMSKLKIYKASAGSGKTYQLAKEFLELLFSDPGNYKYIMAVTFTNKATAEMKSRILNSLFSLANDKKPEFLHGLMKHTGKKEDEIRSEATMLLTFILNDFSHFNITTIDSFFQKIIRSFAFEAGLPTNLRIELETEYILKESIETILKELDVHGNEDLKKWILSQAFTKLREKGDWKITNEMLLLGKEIFKEEFQKLTPEMTKKIKDKPSLDSYKSSLHDIVERFETSVTQTAQKGIGIMQQYGITWDDLKEKSRSPLKIFEKIIKSNNLPNDVTGITRLYGIEAPEDIQNTKNSQARNQVVENSFRDGLGETIRGLIRIYKNEKEDYFTAKAILNNISSYGILTDISETVKRLSREQNIFLLSDANQLLHKIIDNNDTPFIYEKAGTRYRHYMIDEFQDTSDMQWSNFRPLISNSLSENNKSLVVGDVKQSIYRWRNSDWKLLNNYIQHDFANPGVTIKTLTTNWRSFEKIINFNNFIFTQSANVLQTNFIRSVRNENPDLALDEELSSMITSAYRDVEQTVSKNGQDRGGYVNLQFLKSQNNDEYAEEVLPLLCEKIDLLTDAGYEYKDMCILVRTRDEGKLISEYLLGKTGTRYPVISDETLVLESSPAVSAVINMLKYIQDTDNEVLKAYIKLNLPHLDSEALFTSDSLSAHILSLPDPPEFTGKLTALSELKGKPLFEMTEAVIRLLPDRIQQEQASYIRELLNRVQEFISTASVNLSDFLEWWDDKGNTSSISIPEGQNAIKIMTVHKAKGLEFKTVILPFCHWVLDKKRYDSLIWCEPDRAPFNELDLVPVSYTSKLIHSRFVSEYINERLLQYIDNLNLLYVAFTRAKETLIAIGMKKETKSGQGKKEATLTTIADLLVQAITSSLAGLPEKDYVKDFLWDDTAMSFTYGNIPAQKKEKEQKSVSSLKTFRTIPFGKRIKIHSDSSSLEPDILEHYRIHGKLMHLLFEKIKTVSDIEPAIDSLIFEGKLVSGSKQELKSKIEDLLSSPPFNDWFGPGYKVMTEAPILQKNGTARPDRVMIKDGKVVVIDYKFGKMKSEKYRKQVKHYMGLISKMGYNDVEGYLWYLNEKSLLEPVE